MSCFGIRWGLSRSKMIKSAFFQNSDGEIVTELESGKKYTFVEIIESLRQIEKCIAGFTIETLKGLWVINCNTAICAIKEPFRVNANSIFRVEFSFVMPPIMKGNYIVGAAVSEGEIEEFEVLTWLYQVLDISVVNQGANSAIIDINPEIDVYSTTN